MKTISYYHAVNSGDLVAAMAAVKSAYDQTKHKGVIYQRVNMPATYYEGATHPVKNEQGEMVSMNRWMFNMIKPLIESQEYVERLEVFDGQEYEVNFNKIREANFANIPNGPIASWIFAVQPQLSCDLSQPWIELDGSGSVLNKEHILINFTHRYRNTQITFNFLKKWEDQLVFAGTNSEYVDFCNENNLKMPLLNVENFLELAQNIYSCKFILCNQSLCWNIADAMKTPRLLEACTYAPNCFGNIGKDGHHYFNQAGLETRFKMFMKNE